MFVLFSFLSKCWTSHSHLIIKDFRMVYSDYSVYVDMQ